MLEKKLNAILKSYLISATPPKVQVDLPSDVAERTIRNSESLGPYILREAQVKNILFWL